MVVAAGGNKRRASAVALGQCEAQHAAIESKRSFEVGDLEMDVADANSGVNGRVTHVGSTLSDNALLLQLCKLVKCASVLTASGLDLS